MKLLTTVAGIFIIGSVLCTGYKQNTYMTCELYTDNSVNIVEKSINKDLKYLKEDLILPQFQGGKNAENNQCICKLRRIFFGLQHQNL